jgi:hypothetical protein
MGIEGGAISSAIVSKRLSVGTFSTNPELSLGPNPAESESSVGSQDPRHADGLTAEPSHHDLHMNVQSIGW